MAGKIQLAKRQAHDGHDQIGHHGINDLAESAADDHADREVNHVALDRKLPELLHHSHVHPPTLFLRCASISECRTASTPVHNRIPIFTPLQFEVDPNNSDVYRGSP
jgi:hypothetical protein